MSLPFRVFRGAVGSRLAAVGILGVMVLASFAVTGLVSELVTFTPLGNGGSFPGSPPSAGNPTAPLLLGGLFGAGIAAGALAARRRGLRVR